MRLRVTFLFLCLAPAWPGRWADTIHLKNGRTILADHVRENGNRYEYEMGDDSYAIPKSAVGPVEAVASRLAAPRPRRSADLPSFDSQPSASPMRAISTAKIISEGKVDQDGLSTLEGKRRPCLELHGRFHRRQI